MGMFTNAYKNAKGMVTSQRPIQNTAGNPVQKRTIQEKKESAVVEYVNSREYEDKIAEFDNILASYKENLKEYENKLKEYNSNVIDINAYSEKQTLIDDSIILEKQEKLSEIERELIFSIEELKNNQGKRIMEQIQLLIARLDDQREREEEAKLAEDILNNEMDKSSEFDELKEKAENLLLKQDDMIKRIVVMESNLINLHNKISTENRSTLVTQIAEISNSVRKENKFLNRAFAVSLVFNILSLGGIVYMVLYMLQII